MSEGEIDDRNKFTRYDDLCFMPRFFMKIERIDLPNLCLIAIFGSINKFLR